MDDPKSPPQKKYFTSLLYLGFRSHGHPIEKAVKFHLDCKPRVGSKLANPYTDIYNGFHIIFYEIVKDGHKLKPYEMWKTGNLYKNPNISEGVGDVFRQSAFTVSPLSLDKSNK